MNKFSLLILTILGLLSSCHNGEKAVNKEFVPSEDAEITSLVINSCLSSDTAYKNRKAEEYKILRGDTPSFVTIRERDSLIKDRRHQYDSLSRELNEAKLFVLLSDTLLNLHPYYLKRKILDTSGHEIDSLKNSIYDRWASEITITKKFELFEMKNLEFKYNYHYSLHSKFKSSGGVEFFAGYFKLSSILYNANKDKAFVYLERPGWFGFDFFLQKINGHWTIVKRERAWIS